MGMGIQGAGGFMNAASNTNMQQMQQQAQYQQMMNQQQAQQMQQGAVRSAPGRPTAVRRHLDLYLRSSQYRKLLPELRQAAVRLQPPGPVPAEQSTPENFVRTAGNPARKGGSLCQQSAINARTAEEN